MYNCFYKEDLACIITQARERNTTMVLYERYVASPSLCVGRAGLISALAIDCINLSYFRD